jgi:hypothetical protein
MIKQKTSEEVLSVINLVAGAGFEPATLWL